MVVLDLPDQPLVDSLVLKARAGLSLDDCKHGVLDHGYRISCRLLGLQYLLVSLHNPRLVRRTLIAQVFLFSLIANLVDLASQIFDRIEALSLQFF